MLNSQLYPNFCTCESWGSRNKDHRMLLRKELLNFCKNHKFTVLNDFLNLNIRPQIENGTISISPCESLGGFIVSEQSVGLDIEEKSRLSAKLTERISSHDEISMWVSSQYLKKAIWTAKESSFKAFCNLNTNCKIKTISEVKLTPIDENRFIAKFDNIESHGIYFEMEKQLISICTIQK